MNAQNPKAEPSAVLAVFPTGRGQMDTRAPILNCGKPNPNPLAGQPYSVITSTEIMVMIKAPASVPKEAAPWFLPSTYAEHDARTHAAQRAHGLFLFLPVDVDENDLAITDVQAALETVVPGVSQIVFATRSAKPDGRRWRALVPLAEPVAGVDYTDTQNALFDLLEAASGGILIPDRALARPGQLVYLPNRGSSYDFAIVKAGRLALTPEHPIVQRREADRAARTEASAAAARARAERDAKRRAMPTDDPSPVDHFGTAHAISELLARYAYTPAPGGSDDWRSPYQTSGGYATRNCGDHWISLSGSDAAKGIGRESQSGYRHGDAFDLFVHFEHGGDFAAAVAAYGEEMKSAAFSWAGAGAGAAGAGAGAGAGAEGSAGRESGAGGAESSEEPSPNIRPTPFLLRDPSDIPPRQWLYGRHLIRGFVSATVAPGGLGKSSAAAVEALAMASGRALLGDAPACRLRTWAWNGEDPREELERRITAACMHYGLTSDDLGDRLLIDSGRDLPIALASMGKQTAVVARPVGDALIAALLAAKVDVLTVDPLVASHQVVENDNGAMNAVVAEWRRIADAANCAVELVHHVSKAGAMNGDEMGIYAARGAGALIDGVRSGRYLVRMQAAEAERFGVEDATSHFRVVAGKANLTPTEKATWRRMISVRLGNGAGLWQAGDSVGVCTQWTPPDAFDGMTLNDLARVQAAIAERAEPPAHNERASDWVGEVIASTFGLDVGAGTKAERTALQNIARAKVRQLLAGWLKSGALTIEVTRSTRDGRDVKTVVAGEPAHSAGQP